MKVILSKKETKADLNKLEKESHPFSFRLTDSEAQYLVDNNIRPSAFVHLAFDIVKKKQRQNKTLIVFTDSIWCVMGFFILSLIGLFTAQAIIAGLGIIGGYFTLYGLISLGFHLRK